MQLFENEQYDNFFRPFCSKNKRVYYDCIKKLIEQYDIVPELYEADAKGVLTQYFRNCKYVIKDEGSEEKDGGLSASMEPSIAAGVILRYFRKCAWLSAKELGRNGENITQINPYCIKLIGSIEDVFRQEREGELSNSIFAIYDILKSVTSKDQTSARLKQPYQNVFLEIENNIKRLDEEVVSLQQNIREIMRNVSQITSVNGMGSFLLKDELLKKFFSDFFFVSKDGMIPGYIEEIEKILRILHTTELFEKIVNGYAVISDLEYKDAEENILLRLDRIRNYISYQYNVKMNDIDDRINNYYHLYSTRMHMIIDNGVNLQIMLNNLLLALKDMPIEKREAALEELFTAHHIYSYKYLGAASLEIKKRNQKKRESGVLKEEVLTEDEIKDISQEIFNDSRDRFSFNKTIEHFDDLLRDHKTITPDAIKTKDDAYMIVSGISYSQEASFPGTVKLLDTYSVVNGIRTRDFVIERKE